MRLTLVYDDLRLCANDGEFGLYGFAREGQNNVEGAVYGFEWRNGRFNYQQKSSVPQFSDFLDNLSPRRTDFLSPEYMVFPPVAERLVGQIPVTTSKITKGVSGVEKLDGGTEEGLPWLTDWSGLVYGFFFF